MTNRNKDKIALAESTISRLNLENIRYQAELHAMKQHFNLYVN